MFAKKRKSNPTDTGTGYGGNNQDTSRLKAGRKRAEKASIKEDKVKFKYLRDFLKKVKRLGDENTIECDEGKRTALMLADVFRNQIPNDWTERSDLYNAAFDLAEELSCERFVKLLGDAEDAESALYWLVDFGNQAEQILKLEAAIGPSNATGNAVGVAKEDDSVLFATKVAAIRDVALKMARRYNKKPEEEMTMISFSERYQGELGPMRFDTVDSMNNHYFLKKCPSAPTTLDTRKLFKELAAYRNALPVEYGSSCFCRVINSRLDLLRVMITGPDGSPYANGCFMFDVSLSSNYPQTAPKVQFLTTGGGRIRFNPNLYNCGKVCLSLLGTWQGPGWISGESTLLQVLISIQSLILVPDPYFNEPGWEPSRGTPRGEAASKNYNLNIRRHTVDASIESHLTNILNNNNPYPEFEPIMIKHFLEKKSMIEVELKSWAKQDAGLNVKRTLDLFSRLAAREKQAKRDAPRPKKSLPYANVGAKSDEHIELDDSDVEEVLKPRAKKSAGKAETIEIDLSDDDSSAGMKPAPKKAFGGCDNEVVDLT